MKVSAFIAYAAKAVAAFLAPLIMLFFTWVFSKTGVPVPVEFDELSTYLVTILTSIFTAGWVYWQKNAAKVVAVTTTTTEVPKDSEATS